MYDSLERRDKREDTGKLQKAEDSITRLLDAKSKEKNQQNDNVSKSVRFLTETPLTSLHKI